VAELEQLAVQAVELGLDLRLGDRGRRRADPLELGDLALEARDPPVVGHRGSLRGFSVGADQEGL